MDLLRLSSGAPAADRRMEFSKTLESLGDHPGAVEAMIAALELAPGWAAGWCRLGTLHTACANAPAAAAAYGRALELDPSDPSGARPLLELVTGERLADTLPAAFVETLFDQYAPRFDAALTGALAYRGPQIIMAALADTGFTAAGRALDLGCGTGLAGEVLRPVCARLEGVDLSARMLEFARKRAIYDRLEKADLTRAPLDREGFDLIVAADVFNYLGALEGVIAWCAGSLKPGGRLAFTLEAGGEGVQLQPSRRYAHGRDYVEALLARAGFATAAVTGCVVRCERGADVAGFAVTACAPLGPKAREGDGEAEAVA